MRIRPGIIVASIFLSSIGHAEVSTRFVDIRDFVEFGDSLVGEENAKLKDLPQWSQSILDSIHSSPNLYLPKGAVLADLRGVEFYAHPKWSQNQRSVVLSVRILLAEHGHLPAQFHKFKVSLVEKSDSAAMTVDESSIENDSPANDLLVSATNFKVDVGLVARKLILHDDEHGIYKIYPLAVGGLDLATMYRGSGQARILTPSFRSDQGAHLDRAYMIPARHDPAYYRGLPFLPIMVSKTENGVLAKKISPIAFHIAIKLPGDNTDLEHFNRGFESHGCMRLRKKDLLDFYTIIKNQQSALTPVNVGLYMDKSLDLAGVHNLDQLEHPHPFRDNGYWRVQRFAPDSAGREYRRSNDKEHLVILQNATSSWINDLVTLKLRFQGTIMTYDQLKEAEGLTPEIEIEDAP